MNAEQMFKCCYFCMVKCAKWQHFLFAVGFAGTPSLAVVLFYTSILQGQVKRRAPAEQTLISKFGVGKSQTFFLQAVNGGIVMAIFYSGYLVKDGEKYFNATIDDVVSEYHIKGVSFGVKGNIIFIWKSLKS